MPEPIAICIENCYPAHESLRYLRCVAISGAEKKLSFLPGGEVQWQQEEPGHGQIWVSADERLIFHRPAGAVGFAQVHRGGRSVDVPEGKPVVLVDLDYVVVPGFCFRVHIHGPAGALHEPSYLDMAEPASRTRTRLAAAGLMALGTIFGAGAACTTEKTVHEKPDPGEAQDPGQPLPPMEEPDQKENPDQPPVEIRDRPPAPLPSHGYRIICPGDADLVASVAPPATPPIEVRDAPPKPAPPPPPPPMQGDEDDDDDEDKPMRPPMKPPTKPTPPPAMKAGNQPMPPTAGTALTGPPIEVRTAPPSPVPPPPPPSMKPPKRPPMKGDMKGDMNEDEENPQE
jgi:hypothetical protein